MALKDYLAIIDAAAGGDHVIRFAEQMATQHSGQVSGLVVAWSPSIPTMSEAWVVADRIEKMIEDVRTDLAKDVETVRSRLDRDLGATSVEGLLLPFDDAHKRIGLRARHADISIVSQTRPAAPDVLNMVIEACLFESGRPVMIVPPTWKAAPVGRTMLIAWKPTKEAARALADASPLIASADRVVVATVDAEPAETGYGAVPGADICAHLARRGAKVDLVNIASGGRSTARAIEDQALAIGADLIVMGGYGHSRFSELVLGGVTRDLLLTSTLPVFMAH